MRNKNSNIQGRLLIVIKVIFHTIRNCPYYKELLIKERIRSIWEQILSFQRSSHFEKGSHWRESLLDPVVSLWVCNFFSVLARPLVSFHQKVQHSTQSDQSLGSALYG